MDNPVQQKPYDYVNIAFLTLTPVIAVVGTAWYAWNNGIHWLELVNFVFMFLATGLAMTAGYHRYYSHRTYDCNKILQMFYLIFGAAAVQNSVLNWCADHRDHHRFVDTDEDPYNILRGGFYAHIGWVFFKDTRSNFVKYKNIPDLLKDPLIRWQDRWYLPLVLLTSFALPAYVGLILGRPVGGLLWGGFLRVVVVHHLIFFINSLAHMWGNRPYSLQDTARDNWVLAPLTFGEGYHNFHHAFQADYRNGIKWYHFDMAKWWIKGFSWVGWTRRLKVVPEPLIMAAKLKVQMAAVHRKLETAGAPERMADKIHWRLENGKTQLEAALAQYHQAKVEYRIRKDQWSADARKQFAEKIAEYKDEFREAQIRWRDLMRAMSRIPQPSAQSILTVTALMDLIKGRFS